MSKAIPRQGHSKHAPTGRKRHPTKGHYTGGKFHQRTSSAGLPPAPADPMPPDASETAEEANENPAEEASESPAQEAAEEAGEGQGGQY